MIFFPRRACFILAARIKRAGVYSRINYVNAGTLNMIEVYEVFFCVFRNRDNTVRPLVKSTRIYKAVPQALSHRKKFRKNFKREIVADSDVGGIRRERYEAQVR